MDKDRDSSGQFTSNKMRGLVASPGLEWRGWVFVVIGVVVAGLAIWAVW